MTIIKTLGRLGAAAALGATVLTSQAALTTYTSTASFAAATVSAAVDTFDDLPIADIASPLARSVGTYGYTASAPDGLFGAGAASDIWLGLGESLDTLTVNSLIGNVNAAGAFIFGTGLEGAFLAGGDFTVIATDSLGATATATVTGATLTSFVGFVSTGTITSLTFATATPSNDAYATINDLVLAQTPPPIPEPATYGMLLAGLGALAFVRRRRSG